jgi:hypothetical protein
VSVCNAGFIAEKFVESFAGFIAVNVLIRCMCGAFE